jgi:GNAT superfamily N-acetyltransferase
VGWVHPLMPTAARQATTAAVMRAPMHPYCDSPGRRLRWPAKSTTARACPRRGLWSLGGAARCRYRALMAAAKECRLADGRAVALRLAGPDDVPAITALYLGLSSESFYRRFYTARPAPELVTRFASFGSGTVCLVASSPADPGSLVAEARYLPIAAGTAELALAVRDGYQGAGLGHLLLDALVERAGEDGLDRLRAVVLLENTPMLRLLQRYGWVLAAPIEDFSVAHLEISAIGGMPGWPADSAGRRVLVERRSWFDNQQVAALRSAGKDIRQCTGPLHQIGRTCPLVNSGRCRLAEGADVIVSLLPAGEPDCAAVLAAHRRLWPHRLAE